jgi:hypothetical protein
VDNREGSTSIFREEALEHYLHSRQPSELLRASPTWAKWALRLLLLGFLGGLVYASIATVDETAVGPGFVNESGDQVMALLPARYQRSLGPGMLLRLESAGSDNVFEITYVSRQPLDPLRAQQRLGFDLPPNPVLVGPVLEVSATRIGTESLPPESVGRAGVRVDSERVIFALVPGLKELFGAGDG